MASRQARLEQAQLALRNGQAEKAGRECEKLLVENPRDVEARYIRAMSFAANRRYAEAVGDFRRVLSLRTDFLPALINGGIALISAGNLTEAGEFLEKARKLNPAPAELHFGLGLCRERLGDFHGAVTAYREAIARNPRFPDAYNNLGVVYDRLDDLPTAVDCFRHATALHPQFAQAHQNLGNALLRMGQARAAADAFQSAAKIAPLPALAQADLGAALLTSCDYPAAAAALEQALALDPQLPGAAANLGEALRNLGLWDRATAAFQHALAMRPGFPEVQVGLGRIAASRGDVGEASSRLLAALSAKTDDLQFTLATARELEQMGARTESLSVLRNAVVSFPLNADIHDALGSLWHRIGNIREALVNYQGALAIDDIRAETLLNVSRAQESLGLVLEAIQSAERALTIRAAFPDALVAIASCALRLCDWNLGRSALARLRGIPGGIDLLHPFMMIALDLEPDEMAQSLRRRGLLIERPPKISPLPHYSHDRLRIAYLSADFREHPVAHAIAGVIDRHDRKRTTTIAISLSADDGSQIGSRLRASFDEFIDASSLGDREIAQIVREREIDVAIDLAGHTTGARPAVFAMRVAPVQINYLGFPGSLGVDFMDYIIADDIVVPRSDDVLYTERVLRMPHSYLPFDVSRSIDAARPSRAAAGLPAEGFVFCAFNTSYKITEDMFEVWLRLLQDLPESHLWLRSMEVAAMQNLISFAIARGISPERLIFAPFEAKMETHLARLSLADLFLDTVPYNAHTTASEALWAGVPIVTCRGNKFAGSRRCQLVDGGRPTRIGLSRSRKLSSSRPADCFNAGIVDADSRTPKRAEMLGTNFRHRALHPRSGEYSLCGAAGVTGRYENGLQGTLVVLSVYGALCSVTSSPDWMSKPSSTPKAVSFNLGSSICFCESPLVAEFTICTETVRTSSDKLMSIPSILLRLSRR